MPKLDEAAVPVVPYESLRLLIHACDGKGFENKRDEALIRLMVGTARGLVKSWRCRPTHGTGTPTS